MGFYQILGATPASLCTHHEFELVHVFGFGVAVLDFFGKNEAHLEEEEVPLATLLDQRLGIPDVKRFL